MASWALSRPSGAMAQQKRRLCDESLKWGELMSRACCRALVAVRCPTIPVQRRTVAPAVTSKRFVLRI